MSLRLLIIISPILALMVWIGLVWWRNARHHEVFMRRLNRLGRDRRSHTWPEQIR